MQASHSFLICSLCTSFQLRHENDKQASNQIINTNKMQSIFERQFSYCLRSCPTSNPHHHILRYSSVPPRSHSKTLQSCSIPAQSPQRQQASRARSNKCIGSKSNSHIMATSCGKNSTPSHEFY